MLRRLHMLKFTAGIMYVLGYVLGLKEEKMLVAPNVKEGQFLLSEILRAGNFGHYDKRVGNDHRRKALGRNWERLHRDFRLMWLFPSECIWEPVFRLYHYWWRVMHS